MKRPAFQFYPADWLNDLALRQCSPQARSLWVDMLCLMHEGDPYGHLRTTGGDISTAFLCRITGLSSKDVARALEEMAAHKVYSVTESGTIFSRRMVRDEGIRNARATGGEAGKEFGHMGASHGVKGGRPRGDKKPPLADEIDPPLKPSPSSSSSSSSSEKPKTFVQPTPLDLGFQLEPKPPITPKIDHVAIWFDRWWDGYWRKEAKLPALKAFRKHCKSERTFSEIMAATNAQRSAMLARAVEHRPLGASWLNAERWTDAVSESPPQVTLPGNGGPGTGSPPAVRRTDELIRRLASGELND